MSAMLTVEARRELGGIADRLATVSVGVQEARASARAIAGLDIGAELYNAAQEIFRAPLSFLAAEKLSQVIKKGDTVLIVTGFIESPAMTPESDGPLGAVSLATCLNLALGATPVIVTEDIPRILDMYKPLIRAGGLHVYEYDKCKGIPLRAAVEGFTLDDRKAVENANTMLNKCNPSAVIAVEKPGCNDKGVYHAIDGGDISALCAKCDDLFRLSKEKGIFTLGIGDSGNEIGMGCIKHSVRRMIPRAADCSEVCKCGGGAAATTATDLMMTAFCSNWGAYAIEACIAAVFDEIQYLHDSKAENLMQLVSAQTGFCAPPSMLSKPAVDGLDVGLHMAFVDLMRAATQIRLSSYPDKIFQQKNREFKASLQKFSAL